MSKLAYAQVSFRMDYADTMENVTAAKGHVDEMVVVCPPSDKPDAFTEVQELALRTEGVFLVHKDWGDNFPAYRNASLDGARSLGATWILISDADEHFNAELFADLKEKIIPSLEKQGLDMAGIRCFDAFDAIDWWDNLDQLKELPGGTARESTWYKNLLFKLYPDVNYSGTGKGNVHEIWGSQSHPWKATNLPDPYHYTHRKSSLRIWRNAARNLVMGGGGDTVGELNPMWVELRQIMEKMGLADWNAFEKFVTEKKDLTAIEFEPLIFWITAALTFSATDYGTETRETAKWIAWYHRELLGLTAIDEGIKNPPKPDPHTENEMFVRKMYFQVLERHPDRQGLDNYVKMIDEGKMKKEQLEGVLKSSPEYLRKHGEHVRVEAPVSVNVTVTEELIIEVLTRSRLYNEVIKPKLDVGGFVIDQLGPEKEEFLKWFYENRDKLSLKQLRAKLK